MDTNERKAFAERYAEAWCGQEPERVAAFFAPSASLAVNQNEPAVGRLAIAEVARGFMTAFPDMTVSCDAVVDSDAGTEFHWTLAGANTGPGGTGQRVRISGHELWRLGEDGLIASSKGSFDSAEYERQLVHGVDE